MAEAQVGSDARRAASPRPRPLAPHRSPGAAIRAAWRRHRDLLASAGSLLATTGVASGLGFAYWALAARLFSQQAVGYGSAAVSAMTLLGTIGMLGLGTVLIGELPRRRGRAGLVSAALLASCIASLILGLGFAIVAPHFSGRFGHVTGMAGQAALFAAGAALTGVTLVFDQATIGLMRGGLQLTRNVLFAAVKLLALPATAIILHDQLGAGIGLSWVAGMAVSAVPVAIWLWLHGSSVLPRPDWGVLRGLGTTAMAHSWLNLSITVPLTLMPVLVTVVVSPAANAAFYAAWTLSGFLKIVPTHLSTVLFAVASADPPGDRSQAALHAAAIPADRAAGHAGTRARRAPGAEPVRGRLRTRGHRAAVAARHRLPARYSESPLHGSVPGHWPDTARGGRLHRGCGRGSDCCCSRGSVRRAERALARAASRVLR